ncbi:hypothetical protein pb186bvf_018667 [Paramecium bursaria]
MRTTLNQNQTSLQYPAPYPTEYPQQQQPIYAPAEYAQVDPDSSILYLKFIKVINRPNDGYNTGQNKRFGLYITALSLAQLLIIRIFLKIVYGQGNLNFFYKMSTISIFANMLIPIISIVPYKSQSDGIHLLIFIVDMVVSCFSEFGLYALFFEYALFNSYYYLYLVYICRICLQVLMAVAFFYLLIQQKKLNSLVLSILTSIVMALYITYVIYHDHYYSPDIVDYIIPIVICLILSFNFTFALQNVYKGKNKIIRKDRILLGFLQFKVFLYLPCLSLIQI